MPLHPLDYASYSVASQQEQQSHGLDRLEIVKTQVGWGEETRWNLLWNGRNLGRFEDLDCARRAAMVSARLLTDRSKPVEVLLLSGEPTSTLYRFR
jgi:hypothetical protein